MNEFWWDTRARIDSKMTSPPSATAFMHSASATASSSMMASQAPVRSAELGLFFVLLGVG